MKKRTSKLLSLLLTLTMVLGMLPVMSITAFADYADGMDCLACGHYHWDENVCGMCGLCSKECSSSCWEEFHCQYGCGACYLEIDYWCPECGLCEDCMEGVDFHCKECRACLQSDDLCQDCGKCENCVGWLCMDCGQCDECSDDFHCEECGGCYSVNGWEHGTHCADCCEICEQCGGCIILNETEFCFECGLCEACCEENRDASDCSCGEYCVESVEFEEHFCEFCGNCFDDVDQCELCYLCADCCADNSDCSDGLCVEDPDYEDHFCEDCGTCFCEADQCETCAGEGELRCVYCCESLASSYGCDCGDVCVNDPDFEEHLETVHSEDGVIGPHTAKPQNVWSMDETYHWHGCRLCNEDAHITDKANHDYDKYGVCTVCGFKQGAAVFITHQPKDTYAKVTDINAEESDPLHWQNNKVSFKVSAYGQGLTYQWYRVADGGTPTPLTTSDSRLPSYGEGADTDKVTVSVPGDACTTVYTYYCVVTDKDGNTAESIHARIKAGHVYSRCQNVATGSEKTIYVQTDETFETKKYQDTEGHYWSCCGEEDFGDGVTDFGNTRTKAPVNHSYGNQELIWATIYSDYAQAGTFSTYYRYTCSDCGHQIYVEKHTHNFECPVPGTEENNKYLEEHCTALTHPLVCTVGGCTETRTAQHRWEAWRIADYPTAEGPGHMRRECLDCQYPQDKEWTDKNGDPVQWTTANMLVTAVHGTVNRSMAAPGDKLTLTPEQIDDQKCTGWTADYTDYSGETRVTKTVSVTVTQNSDGTWSCTVPTFAAMGVNGGGQLGFTAQFAACTHSRGTRIEGARNVVCTRNGYTGDKVCVDCGQILVVGDPIPGGKEHTGTLIPVLNTAVKADCTHRGYTGDFKCSACGGIVPGERTGYKHGDDPNIKNYVTPTCTTEGYSGDEYCNLCDKLLAHGKTLPISHGTISIKNIKSPTCTDSGYSGDKYCQKCGETVEWGKTTPPRGHNWNTGTVTKQPTATERGERLLTCLTCSETKIEYIPRLSESGVLISRVIASVQRPITDETPAEAVPSKPDQYTVIRTVWLGTPAVFQPDTQYTVRITLKANDGYRFPAVGESFQGYVNGNTATIGDRSTDQVTIEYTFPKTTPADHVHVFNDEMADPEALAREADCTHNAVYYYSCVCGKIGTAETFEREDSALGHDWSEDWSNDADDHWHVCTRCSAIDTETKAAHDLGDDYICDICGYDKTPAHTHSYGDEWKYDANNHWHECSCGAIDTETKAAHAGVLRNAKPATATEDGYTGDTICKVCKYEMAKGTVIPATGEEHTHSYGSDWKYDADKHWHECSCGAIDTETKADHVGELRNAKPATATEDGYTGDTVCKTCEYVIAKGTVIPATGGEEHTHSYGAWSKDETYHWHECTDASCPDKTGSVKDQAAHTASDWIIDTPATSTTSGSKHKECIDCHQVLVTETIPATGSSSVSGVTTYAITVEEADNGNVTADRKSAAKGTTVTLTIAPDKGYTLETLTVTDKNGDELKIKEKNGKYTFTMPASKVYVEATFMEDNSMLNFFVDVPADAYYYDAVLWAADKEITGGTDAVHFSPDATCTRAQAVTFLWRAVGSPLVNYDMNFSDVPADAYYTEAVRWAVSQGITKGTGETTFSPNATCTRGQIVTFLYRTVQAQGGGMQGAWMFQNPFTDVSLESYCGEAVMWAVANGITEGTSETTFGPDARCTRGQIVTFLFRCLGK